MSKRGPKGIKRVGSKVATNGFDKGKHGKRRVHSQRGSEPTHVDATIVHNSGDEDFVCKPNADLHAIESEFDKTHHLPTLSHSHQGSSLQGANIHGSALTILPNVNVDTMWGQHQSSGISINFMVHLEGNPTFATTTSGCTPIKRHGMIICQYALHNTPT